MVSIGYDYDVARQRFLAAAAQAGAEVASFVHPNQGGAGGCELAVDLAWLGPATAQRVLLVTSGMHGFEGPAGSEVQSLWLEADPSGLAPDTAVVLVHALNPWGFAYVSRLTENNVDLNRNFIDWSGPRPANPYYHHIRDAIRVKDLSPETLMGLMAEQARLVGELGPAAMQVASDYGQYEDPQGLTFGGAGPEFGHQVMRQQIVPRLANVTELGLIDLHTGVGAYGEVAILPIDGAASANAQRLLDWWGKDLVQGWKRSTFEAAIEADPNTANLPVVKTGEMREALVDWLPKARVTGAVVEFGTETQASLPEVVFVTLYERWLRFEHGGDRMAPEHKAFRDAAWRCYTPSDPAWCEVVRREGPALIHQALAGLARL